MTAQDVKEKKPDLSQDSTQDSSQDQPERRTDGKIQVVIGLGEQKTKFLIKPSTAFSKVFASFYNQTGAQEGTYKFEYNGQRVQPQHTPSSLDMQDDDEPEITAHLEQLGGACGHCL